MVIMNICPLQKYMDFTTLPRSTAPMLRVNIVRIRLIAEGPTMINMMLALKAQRLDVSGHLQGVESPKLRCKDGGRATSLAATKLK